MAKPVEGDPIRLVVALALRRLARSRLALWCEPSVLAALKEESSNDRTDWSETCAVPSFGSELLIALIYALRERTVTTLFACTGLVSVGWLLCSIVVTRWIPTVASLIVGLISSAAHGLAH